MLHTLWHSFLTDLVETLNHIKHELQAMNPNETTARTPVVLKRIRMYEVADIEKSY